MILSNQFLHLCCLYPNIMRCCMVTNIHWFFLTIFFIFTLFILILQDMPGLLLYTDFFPDQFPHLCCFYPNIMRCGIVTIINWFFLTSFLIFFYSKIMRCSYFTLIFTEQFPRFYFPYRNIIWCGMVTVTRWSFSERLSHLCYLRPYIMKCCVMTITHWFILTNFHIFTFYPNIMRHRGVTIDSFQAISSSLLSLPQYYEVWLVYYYTLILSEQFPSAFLSSS